MTTAFATLGLCPGLVQTVTALGYTQPTPIQGTHEVTGGRDVLGQAQTGTGKSCRICLAHVTAPGYAGTGVQGTSAGTNARWRSRWLEAIYRYGHRLGAGSCNLWWARPTRANSSVSPSVPMVVGTPGRTLDLLRQGALDLGTVRYLVLDEADAMLQMGFIEDVKPC